MTDTDRIETVAQAIAEASRHTGPYGISAPGRARVNGGHRAKAVEVLAALDAYDREHRGGQS